MSDMDFSDLGREIGEKIEKFVNSKEIKDLQENIRVTVESTMGEVRRSAKEAADYVNKNVDIRFSEQEKSRQAAAQSVQEAEKQKIPKSEKYTVYENKYQYGTKVKPYNARQLPIVRKPKGRVSGVLLTVFGTIGAVISWTTSLLGYAFFLLTDNFFGIGAVTLGFSAGIAGVCTLAAAFGGFLRRRAKRFKNYVKAMGVKDFYSIEGLAQIIQKKEKFVIKDLKKMIKRGWFKEGHLDEQETCFMLTNESYQMYLDAQEELRQRKEETERQEREREQLEQDPERKQLKIAIEEGREYIRRIRDVNDDIPGEEISKKLYRLEKISTRIYEYVEETPSKLSDIRKFMSYYLPTTLKLVEAYYQFSIQPVQGENITTAKKEIEETLDDINAAFEKMFDKLFENKAMDISTDISVLSAMLAQEGLLEDEFKLKEEEE